jgi:hypothetical protein
MFQYRTTLLQKDLPIIYGERSAHAVLTGQTTQQRGAR